MRQLWLPTSGIACVKQLDCPTPRLKEKKKRRPLVLQSLLDLGGTPESRSTKHHCERRALGDVPPNARLLGRFIPRLVVYLWPGGENRGMSRRLLEGRPF